MSILIICLLISMGLPFLSKIPVAIAMNQQGGYNNQYPREQQAKLSGFGARALAAHQNSFEALMVFSAAVILAIATNNTGEMIQNLAITHVVARFVYHLFYLMNWHSARSIIWAIGLFSAISIVVLCLP